MAHRVKGPASSSDIETWVTPETWREAIDLVAQAMVLLHEQARPARTEGTLHVSASSQAFVMGDPRVTWKDAAAPLRERSFAWYFASRFTNTLGSMMANIALAFAVLDITDSASALGQVLAAHTIPMILLLLWGGVISDRFPRTLVLQVSNVASAASQGLLAFLVITGAAELWMVIVLTAVHGAVSAISFPAMASMVPQLVPRSQLQPANALLSLTRNGLTVLGPTTGALLVVTVGSGWALAVDAAMWLLSALLLLPVQDARERTGSSRPAPSPSCARDGRSSGPPPGCGPSCSASASLNMIHNGALFTLGPVVAQDTIGRQGWGYVLSAEALGLLAMTVVLLRVPLRRPLFWGMIAIALAGLPMIILGVDPHPRRARGERLRRRRRHRGVLHGLEPRDAGEHRRRHAVARLLLRRARILRRDADRSARVGPARRRVRQLTRAGLLGHRVRRHLPARALLAVGPGPAPAHGGARGPGHRWVGSRP